MKAAIVIMVLLLALPVMAGGIRDKQNITKKGERQSKQFGDPWDGGKVISGDPLGGGKCLPIDFPRIHPVPRPVGIIDLFWWLRKEGY